MKKTLLSLFILLLVGVASASSKQKAVDRIQDAGAVLDEIMRAPDRGIPSEIMGAAECVAVVPDMMKGGFVFGGEYGRGVATCRDPHGWSAPVFFTMGGGSFGLQFGGQSVDLVMVVMNERGMQALLSSHFKLGADASAAAGPIGRHAEGMTDWKMRAEVLTYSRARGIFAGVTLNGAVVKMNGGETEAFYGKDYTSRQILRGEIPAPADAQPFLSAVAKYNEPAVPASKPAAAPAPAAPAASTTAPADAAKPEPATGATKPVSQASPAATPVQPAAGSTVASNTSPPAKPSPVLGPN